MIQTAEEKKYFIESQARFHKIYRSRITLADGRRGAMENDLADFDKGVELLLQGRTYRACIQEMQRFPTVYGWILQKNLPRSFRDYAARRKKIRKSFLSYSPSFAYLVGAYQAKIRVIHPMRIAIVTRDSSLEQQVEDCFNALHMTPSNKPFSRTSRRIYYDSPALMSHLSEITENNSRIPRYFYLPNLMGAYLSGFCDARATPHCSKSKSKCSSIVRIYPRIVITKKNNIPLLSAVNSALNFLGVASKYNADCNPDQICIDALGSIKDFVDLGLFRSREKMGRLKEMYNTWKETKEFDSRSAFEKSKKQILLERAQKEYQFSENSQNISDEDDWD